MLCANAQDRSRLGAWVNRSGFEVKTCDDVGALFEQHALHRCAYVVLAASHADVLIAAARLRTLHPPLGIVAINHDVPADVRVQLLLCGVDTCLDARVGERELAAVLQALARRAVHPPVARAPAALAPEAPVEPAGAWRLQDDGWVLVSPHNHRLPLSGTERALVGALLQAPTRRMSRDQLMDVVDVRPERGGRTRLRYVDVLVCRLRRKAAEHDVRLPIRAVHGWGYMFGAEV